MQAALEPFRTAYAHEQAWGVANALKPFPPRENPGALYDFHRATNEHAVHRDIEEALGHGRIPRKEAKAWVDIFVTYWSAVGEIIRAEEATNQGRLQDGQYVHVYEAWKDVVNLLMRSVSNGFLPPWTIICMYTAANHLRMFAIIADKQLANSKDNITFASGFQDDIVSPVARNDKLEDTARLLNRMFGLCTGDRNPDMSSSRKWGTYYVANLQFKTYFKLKNVSLSKNVVRTIEAQTDLPRFELFPAAHRVTYKYFVGVLAFLQEDYTKAEECLTYAWDNSPADATNNQELILIYLIPCRLITKHNIPSEVLLSSYPRLQKIFAPLFACIKRGDLSGFDDALVAGEAEFVRRRIYLTLERGRDIALRNLFRKVFLVGGFEDLKEGQTEKDRVRKTRIPIANFAAAMKIGMAGDGSGELLENDEVECMLANMIYKGLMKGYISREHVMVVLNKKGAFPGTGI